MVSVQSSLTTLFDEAAQSLRQSVRQSNTAIVSRARSRLKHVKEDAESLNVLAADSLLRGRPERSLQYLRSSTELLLRSATANRTAGYACLISEDLESAEQFFSKAADLMPCQSDTWVRLGIIQESRGETEKAIQNYERGLFFEDGTHDCAIALSRLYAAREDFSSAIASLRSAVLRDRRDPGLNERLAELLMRRAVRLKRLGNITGREKALDQAIRHFKVFVSVQPSCDNYVRLGFMEFKRERFANARKAYEAALKIDPENAAALSMVASLNVAEGRIEESKQQFREVFRRQEASPHAHFRYARIVRFQPGPDAEQHEARLRRLLLDVRRPIHHRVSLLFALGKLLDDLGRHEEAWQNYAQANRMKVENAQRSDPPRQSSCSSEPVKVRCGMGRLADDQIRLFDTSFFSDRSGWGVEDESPIFVVGMPRSGTTLTEQILSSHRCVAGGGELKHLEELRRQLRFELRSREISIQCSDSEHSKSSETDGVVSQLTQARVQRMADAYLQLTKQSRGKSRFLTDKMPTNFAHLGLVALMFPRAKILHCRRDPMDVIVSAFCQNLAPPFCDLDAITDYYLHYRRLMAHWEKVLPIKIYHLDYETTVADPRSTTRGLLHHCGLQWDENCMSHHENKRAVHTPSKWQVRQPIYSSSVGKWRRFATHLESVAERISGACT